MRGAALQEAVEWKMKTKYFFEEFYKFSDENYFFKFSNKKKAKKYEKFLKP